MMEIGYKLCSEEHSPNDLVHFARRAEEAGFQFAMISDHYHPWTDRQGNSPFVWSVIGAVAHATERLRLGTGVTCPTIRIHPAIIAQAAATAAAMMPGRFILGVGSGENLNEHILGDRWPAADVRQEMLEEAVAVIRLLWQGGQQSYYGNYYTVENARIYTLPDEPPPILVAAAGPKSAALAGRIGDGLIGIAPDAELLKKFQEEGGKGKPCYGEVAVCWAQDEAEARRTAFERWPIAGMKGELTQELPVPAHFEQAAKMLTEDAVAETVICGPDPARYVEKITKYAEAGFDHVWLHQVGPDQEGFFQFFERELQPELKHLGKREARPASKSQRAK
ncbi:MAG TPA: TIGR03557 family F420-dependent LLM class oxidoreductase [Blastocatellia bacterium]|nr:TIGR03557 family F420-dependent LLM class oxidoreductase [Blastocatellia bacterium]